MITSAVGRGPGPGDLPARAGIGNPRLGRRLVGGTAPELTAFPVWALTTLGVLALWVVAFAYLLSSLVEGHAQALARNTIRQRLATGTVPVSEPIKHGSPIARIRIPQLGVDAVVTEGTSAGDTQKGPGHRRDTVLPGEAGVSVIFGRGALFGGPFARITRLQRGEAIDVTTGEGTFHFDVDRVRRAGDRLPPRPGAGEARLTLVTAESSGHGFSAVRRVVFVDASLRGPASPAPTILPIIAAEERPMSGEVLTVLPALTAWLSALLAVLVVACWALFHWGRRQTALVGIPVGLAILWGCAQTALRLLPNLA